MSRDQITGIVNAHAPAEIVDLKPDNLHAVDFRLMKIHPAAGILTRALATGEIKRGDYVCETSSGTMALGCAVLAKELGLHLHIFGDKAIDPSLQRTLEQLGTEVEIIEADRANGNIQELRKARLLEFQKQSGAMWLSQYDNPNNRLAYGDAAKKIIKNLGKIDCLVASVGSGGSSCGLAGYLRHFFPEMKLIGVDTFGSVIFGQKPDTRELRGLGNSIIPKNVIHEMFDEVHWLGAHEAYHATHELLTRATLKRGPTSGAAYAVARHYAEAHPNARVLAVFPDDSLRYEATIYNPEWLAHHGYLKAPSATRPMLVAHPREARSGWCRYLWRRRSLSAVQRSNPISFALGV